MASFSGSSPARANSCPWTRTASSQRPVLRASRRISSWVARTLGLDREAAQHLVERARRIVHPAFPHLGPQAQEIDPLGHLGAGPRDPRVDLQQRPPVLGAAGQPLDVGEQLAPGRIRRQGLAERGERTLLVVQLVLADERDLQRRRQLLDGLVGPGAGPVVDLDQLLVQAMPLGRLIEHLQPLGVRPIDVGPPVPLERAERVIQVILVERRDLQVDAAPFDRLLDLFEQLLVGERQPLVVTGLEVEGGRGGQRRRVVRIDLQHPLVDRDRLAVVTQPVARQLAEGHRRRHPLRGILGQEQLSFGDLDDARPVLVALVDGPQARVRLLAAGIDLGDEAFEGLRGGVGVEQLLFEELRAREGQGDRAAPDPWRGGSDARRS